MKTFIAVLISSLIIITFAIPFHYFNFIPNDWSALYSWLPLYLSPVFVFGAVDLFSKEVEL